MRFLLVFLSLFSASTATGETCIGAPYDSTEDAAQRELSALYANVSTALVRFPSLAETMETRAPQLCTASQMDEALGFFDVDRNRIVLSEDLSGDMKLIILLHEIRHLNQFAVGACPSDDLAMEEYALATSLLEADSSAISLLVAWDMKERGNPRAWDALAAWPTQSDIAARFAEEMQVSGSVESAVSAAFEQWFASEARRESYYLSVCSGYLDRQDASKALPRYQLVPSDFYAELCKLPNGTRYRCSKPQSRAR